MSDHDSAPSDEHSITTPPPDTKAKKRGNASKNKASPKKKAKSENGKGGDDDKKAGNGTQAGSSSGAKAARPGAWTPEMKATLFREMMQTPGMALFNEIGPKVGKSGSQVKDQWRNTLMPMILKKIEESG